MRATCLAVALIIGSVTACWVEPAAALADERRADETSVIGPASDLFSALRRGDYKNAVRSQTDTLRLSRKAGDRLGEMNALFRRGEAYQVLGHHRKAIEDLESALALAEKSGNQYRVAAVSGSLGNAYLMVGAFVRARSALESALKLARAANFNDVAAATLNNLGNLFAAEGNGSAAETAYSESERFAFAANEHGLAARAKINAARLSIGKGDYPGAEAKLQEVLHDLLELPASHDQATHLIALGGLLGKIGTARGGAGARSTMLAYTAFNRAAGISAAVGDVGSESYAFGNLARLYEAEGRDEEALRLARRALFLAQTVNSRESLYRWQWLVGRILEKGGATAEAISAYQGAVNTLQSLRADLPGVNPATGRSTFREAVGAVYLQLANLLLKRAEKVDGNEEQYFLTEARGTVELLKTAELEDYFKDQCVADLQARVKPVDRLAARTAAIYPILLPDRLVLLVTLPDRLVQVSLPITSERLTREVRAFRLLLEKRTTRQFLPHARQLYEWLIRPVEPYLESHDVDTLVFVPDGALRTVPLAALHDGTDFLIKRYAVATVPGLTLIDPRPIPKSDVKLLLNGLTEAVQGFQSLPFVSSELAAIQNIYGGTVLKDKDFVVSRLKQSLATTPYSVVHIASHAVLAEDPKDSFLLTFDGRLDMDGLEQFIKLGRFRDKPVELLTLSACRTAAGDDRAALGLAGIAVKAGARSVLATLWFINDQTSSLLVSDFYRQLRQSSLSKAKALQRAQSSLIEDPRYRHPGYWSPFLIIGNWL